MQLFVNSVDREHGREWIGTPDALAGWFRDNGVPCDGLPAESDVARAHALREALRSLLRANNLGGEAAAAARLVDAVGLAAGLRLALDEEAALRVAVERPGVDGALGRIVAAAFEAMLDGSWPRLKTCRNCDWAFYDTSKNRSGSWCSMQLCGNRTKTRAYRQRKAGR